MPDFTQWNVPTPFTNVLYNPMAVDKAANDAETARQTIGANDIAMVGRAAGSLLNMSESDAAAAYPGMIADLQRQGFARNAPSEYPGHAAVQGLVQRGLTVPEQYNSGLLTAPGVADALKAAGQPLSFGNNGVVTGGGGAGGPRASDAVGGDQITNAKAIHAGLVARGMDNETALAMSANLLGESGGNWQTNPGDGGASHGIAQWNKERLAAFQAANGGKLPAQTNLDAQLDFLTKEWKADHNGAATAAGQFGTAEGKIAPIVSKYEVSANQPADIARRSAYLNQLRAAGIGAGGGTAVATAPINPNAGPRVGTLPPPPVAATAPTIAPANPTTGNPNAPVQIPPVQTSQADVPVPPSPVAARTGGTDVAGPGAGPDTTLPAVPQPNRMYQTGLQGVTIAAPGNALAPTAQTAAAPPAPVAQSPAAPAAPAAAPQPRTGQNSPQFQAAMELNRRAQALDMVVDPTGRTKALAASLRAQAALYMQADSVTYDPRTGIGTKAITGEQVSPAKPLSDYHETSPGSGIWVGGPGTEPKFQPPGRLIIGKDGKVWETGVGGAKVLDALDPKAVAALSAAQAQGTGVGTDVAKQVPALVAQGREATQAIGNIDYGVSQLQKAQQRRRFATGYFADALATTAAKLKSLGFPTDKVPFVNVDPSAVGNIQTAQKTLAIVSSAILKQALGGRDRRLPTPR